MAAIDRFLGAEIGASEVDEAGWNPLITPDNSGQARAMPGRPEEGRGRRLGRFKYPRKSFDTGRSVGAKKPVTV